jgi:serine/threonine protein kinase
MVLEYMSGGSLHDLLHNPTPGRGDLPAQLLARILAEVASGVAYLHSNGVMHRDVKTANVLLDDACHAKVTDFGISTRFCRTGMAEFTAETGTYRQMAPEVMTSPRSRQHRYPRTPSGRPGSTR